VTIAFPSLSFADESPDDELPEHPEKPENNINMTAVISIVLLYLCIFSSVQV
jgi:hypothetical protein